jgi:hypothetical protein
MNTALKLQQAMRRNPAGDWKFSHAQLVDTLTVPARRPIKAIYIKHFLMLLDALQESTNGEKSSKG